MKLECFSKLIYWFVAGLYLLSSSVMADSALTRNIAKLKVPAGFKIELFADNLPNARTMVLGSKGTVFVGTRRAGKVYAINNNRKYVIASGLEMPNGIAFLQGNLYVAEVSRILRFDGIEERLAQPPKPVVIYDDLPIENHHGWRYIGFSPEKRLTVAIGAPCNVCLETDYALIKSMKPDGTDVRIEAKGVRNSVGFTWHPQTKKLWFSDNGRDMLGDDIPADEINRIDKAGQHFGFPYCHGGDVVDPEFNQKPCRLFSPPVKQLGAHVAPLGITFYTGNQFPKAYKNQLFVAEHGSWNRSKKVGYRVALARFNNERVVSYEAFVSGWLKDEKAWGRPAYLLVMPDGSLLISDDKAGAIYRVSLQARALS